MTPGTPAPGDGAGWKEFTAKVAALVDGADPLVVLRETPAWLRSRIEGAAAGSLRRTERPDGWSAIGVIEHLADAELVFGYRLRQVLTLETPPLASFDQDRWAVVGRYNDADPIEALQMFEALRSRHLNLWHRVQGTTWERTGIHADRGPESLRDMVRIIAGHDLAHRRQITRLLTDGPDA
jgi:hypothetical protein